MASLQPQKCCAQGYIRKGEPTGSITSIADTEVYVVGDKSSDNILLFLPDVLGIRYPNAQILADSFANNGFLVFVVDTFEGHPMKPDGDLKAWIGDHMPDRAHTIVDKVLAAIKQAYSPKFVAGVGYCYGANPLLYLANKKDLDVIAIAHPSFVSEELVRGLKTPLIISAAETDSIFTDELRQKTLEILREIKADYYVQVLGGTNHGFAARGNPQDPVVEAAREKVFDDQIWFFSKYQK